MSKLSRFLRRPLRRLLRVVPWFVVGLGTIPVLLGSAAFLYLSPNLPSVDVLRDVQLQTPLRIYTRDGELIGEFGEMRRTPIELKDLPPGFINAVLAAEDDSFFTHHGVDFTSLARAASELLATGHIRTGGSTITMQVAKNYFLTQERTFARKFNEILLAFQIEHELSKQEILELYLNKIFLGNRAYGVAAAAEVYYGKPLRELSLAQWAMIAGLPKAPSAHNPIANPERALQRRNWILGRMLSLGYIDRAQHDAAVREPLGASYHGAVADIEAAYAAEMVRQELLQRFGTRVYTDGFIAYTTLDGPLQHKATGFLREGLLSYDRRHGYRGPERRLGGSLAADRDAWMRRLRATPLAGGLQPAIVTAVDSSSVQILLASGDTAAIDWDNGLSAARRYVDEDHRGPMPKTAADVLAVGDLIRVRRDAKNAWELRAVPALEAALISIDADSGAIISLVGGFDFRQSKFNRITQAQRQAGSGFKPFIYTAALENGFTAATLVNDAPIVFDDGGMPDAWRPENDTGKFYGPTPLRQALYKSRNVVSVRVLQQLGIDTAVNYVERFGFDRKDVPRNLSVALGSLSVTPMQMARGFAVFANGGYLIEPHLLQRVANRQGEILYEAKPPLACPDCPNLLAPAAAPLDELTPAQQPPANTAPQVLDKRYAFIMHTMLRDVVARGTATAAARLGRGDMAGKTGTTTGPVDTWFTGYSGGVVTSAWAGFDNNTPMGRDEYGATVALPIWMDYMRVALQGRPERYPRQPEGVVSLRIDPRTGQLASADLPDAVFEYFAADHLPGDSPFYGGPSIAPAAPGGISEHDLF